MLSTVKKNRRAKPAAGNRAVLPARAALVVAAAAVGLSACLPAQGSGGGAGPVPSATASVTAAPTSTVPPSTAPTSTAPAGTPGPSTPPTAGPTPTAGATPGTSPAPGGGGGTPAATALSGTGYADHDEWASWRGWPVQISETWNDAKDPATGVTTWGSMNGLYTVKQYFTDAAWPGELSLAQPMFAGDQNVKDCATEEQISTLMNKLVEYWPSKNAFIRLGWEFNGNWYHWSVQPGDAEAFNACWIRWHDVVKSISPDFKLVWNPNAESSNQDVDVTEFWPGAQYVDAAGPDFYAISDNGQLRGPDKRGPHGEPLGIGAWAAWVAEKGVPLAVPEWGVNDQDWGSTDPAFITQMRTVFTNAAASPTGLAYESYFDGSKAYSCKFTLHDKECGYEYHQAAAQRYKELWTGPYTRS